MARDVKLGYILTATDNASKTFSRVASNMSRSIGAGIVVANQGLALMTRLSRMASRGLIDTVKAALKFRTDGVAGDFREFGENLTVLRARLGDAIIPVLQALMETLSPIVSQMQAWLKENNKLIASKLFEYVDHVAGNIANFLLPAIGLAAAAFDGWRMIFQGVRIAWAKTNEVFLKGIVKIVEAWQTWKVAIGDMESAQALGGTIATLKEMVTESETATETQVTGLGILADNLREHQELIKGYQTALNNARGTFRSTFAVLNKGTTGGNTVVKQAAEDAVDLTDALNNIPQAAFNGFTPAIIHAELFKEQLVRTREETQSIIDRAVEMGSAFGNAFGAYVAGTASAGEAAKSFAQATLASIREVVMGLAIKWAMNAANSQAGIPIVGPALAVAAAAAAFAVAESYMAKFHDGGFIGGTSNATRRERPFIGLDGEYVMSHDEVRAGRPRWAAGGGGDVNVDVTVNTLFPPMRADWERYVRNHVKPAMRTARRNGQG